MTTNQQMFLLVAEELSFTRAAARAYVSQSCLSDHVRRLEEAYGVRLFDRSPKLKLTAAGETLCRALRQIQSIERGVQQEFSGSGALARGTVTLGIHPVRARQLLPGLLAAYREEYPGIHLSVVLGETRNLAPQLLDGKLDLLLGVDCPPLPQLHRERLHGESIYLLAARSLLQSCLPQWAPEQKVFPPELLPSLPLVCNPPVSTLSQALAACLSSRGIPLEPFCTVGDYYIQLALCREGRAAAFCPESFLREVLRSNLGHPLEEPVLVFSMEGLDNQLRVELVTHASHYTPGYTTALADALRRQYESLLLEGKPLIK